MSSSLMSIRIPEDLHEQLMEYRERRGLNKSQAARRTMKRGLDHQQRALLKLLLTSVVILTTIVTMTAAFYVGIVETGITVGTALTLGGLVNYSIGGGIDDST